MAGYEGLLDGFVFEQESGSRQMKGFTRGGRLESKSTRVVDQFLQELGDEGSLAGSTVSLLAQESSAPSDHKRYIPLEIPSDYEGSPFELLTDDLLLKAKRERTILSVETIFRPLSTESDQPPLCSGKILIDQLEGLGWKFAHDPYFDFTAYYIQFFVSFELTLPWGLYVGFDLGTSEYRFHRYVHLLTETKP